jgi:hypothetical protein
MQPASTAQAMAKLNVNNRTPVSLFAVRRPRILPQNADDFSTVMEA